MSPRLQAIVHGVEWGLAVVGAVSAGALTIGGTGGLLSVALGVVHGLALVAVGVGAALATPAFLGVLTTSATAVLVTSATAVLVAWMQIGARRREAQLARVEAKLDKLADILADLVPRVSALEALRPEAEARAHAVEALQQDLARVQGFLRRDP